MTGSLLISILLFAANALFVAAEYALVSARRVRIKSLADKGNRAAAAVLRCLDDKNQYVAGIQIGITFFSIGIGAVSEPALSQALGAALKVHPTLLSLISIVIVSYPLVVLAELVPKYLTIRQPERVALFVVYVLIGWSALVRPLIWLFDSSGNLVLRAFGINPKEAEKEAVSRDEISLLLQAGESEGQFDEQHADVILRALRLDKLKAGSVMVHRLDMECLRLDLEGQALWAALSQVRHSRLPVYGEDLDDIKGVVYLQDLVRGINRPSLSLKDVLKPAEFIPENLSLDRSLSIMRQRHSQILIVQDEHGGTSGMITLEDIVEEVLGDLEDRVEAERPAIERVTPTRIRLTPYVRWDELLEFLDVPITEDVSTMTVAQLVHQKLQKVPNQGDSVDTDLGKLVVDQTTRRRLIQLSLYLNSPELKD
jgi:putative hemolysin